MNDLTCIAMHLKIISEESLNGKYTEKETVEQFDLCIKNLAETWEQYKKDNGL
ncbi:hypothetical protein [Clostridium estertheticum]|uniref:hypothetical protein n=1 Tax=Clostridium estertheticum TaxID=238834 RepID=UPI001C0B2B38|nr:hypothetical protein [Clostridium estertheticum]MBU3186607.1 hypothetical protein [Clostridium estertheticum]